MSTLAVETAPQATPQTAPQTAREAEVLLIAGPGGLAQAVEHVLAAEGHHCSRRAPGDDVLSASGPCPELVILDTGAEGTGALGLCEPLRRDPALATCRLLVLHGSGKAVDRRRAEALGADGFLAKPFPMQALRSEIARLLSTPGKG